MYYMGVWLGELREKTKISPGLTGRRAGTWSRVNSSRVTYLLTYVLTYLLTYLLTPKSRVLLEKLTGFQPVKKFPAFH